MINHILSALEVTFSEYRHKFVFTDLKTADIDNFIRLTLQPLQALYPSFKSMHGLAPAPQLGVPIRQSR